MPLKSKVILGPIEKYKWYGVFPGKFVVHLLIVILSSQLGLYYNAHNNDLYLPQTVMFFYTFLSDNDLADFQQLTGEYAKDQLFYDIEDMNTFVNSSVAKYYSLADPETNKAFGNLSTSTPKQERYSEPQAPRLRLKYSADSINKEIDNPTNPFNESYLSLDDMQQFNDLQKTKDMVKELDYFEIDYLVFATYSSYYSSHARVDWIWNVTQHYDCSLPSMVITKLNVYRYPLNDETDPSDKGSVSKFYIYMHSILAFLCLVSLYMNVNHYRKLSKTFDSINEKYDYLENAHNQANFVSHQTEVGLRDTSNNQSALVDRFTNIKS